MAILKGNNFEIEITYFDLNECDEIEYQMDFLINGIPLFNRELISEYYVDKFNGKLIVSDCRDDFDWLMDYFIKILKTRKGYEIENEEPPNIRFNIKTWENIREEREKSWEGRTCWVQQENGETIKKSYNETMKLFLPSLEDQVEIQITLPSRYFISNDGGHASVGLIMDTDFGQFSLFVEEFQKEMFQFFERFKNRIIYAGSGKYEVIYDEDISF